MVNTLRERLWDLRKRRIKIVEVAKLSGVSQSTFTKLMHEKNPVLNSDVLERIERAVSFYEKELEESDSKVAVG